MGTAEIGRRLDLARLRIQTLITYLLFHACGYLFGEPAGFFLFSFFKTVRFTPSPRLPDRGQEIRLSERSESHEAQIEDQCFKETADGWDRDLQKSHGQGQAAEVSLRRQTQSDRSDTGRQCQRDRHLRDKGRRRR